MTSTNPDVAGANSRAVGTRLAQAMRSSRVVDLSLTLSEDLPCAWPGAMPYRHVVDNWFETTAGGNGPRLRSRTGVPTTRARWGWTSIPAPISTPLRTSSPPPGQGCPTPGRPVPSPATGCRSSSSSAPAVVVDVRSVRGSAGPGCSPRIEPGLITDWEAANGAIAPGDVVLFRGDWDEHYVPGPAGRTYVVEPLVFSSVTAWPAPSPETMELLRDRGVRCVGTDSVSMGPAEDAAPVHVVGPLGRDGLYRGVEPPRGTPARGATFVFLPVKIGEGSGGPGRALAFIDR